MKVTFKKGPYFVFESEFMPVAQVRAVCVFSLQEDNGMPVHLKGGSADALLYRSTMVLTIVGEHSHSSFSSQHMDFIHNLSK